jgi:hypothetical protein
MELHLGVSDDPRKGRAEAHSKTIRDKTWDWFADDFLSRFAKDGALLIVMTRWHVDDLLGRFLEKNKDVKVLRYPAIAEHDERHLRYNTKDGKWEKFWRRQGEALFPQHKPLDFLLERKKLLTESAWESIYQQTPIIVGGGILPIEKLKVVPIFDRSKVTHTVRYFDKACLVTGTMITTKCDDIPIEDVAVRDQVLTRRGFRRVKRAWLSKWASDLTSVICSNGAALTGTPDHPVNRGGYRVELGRTVLHPVHQQAGGETPRPCPRCCYGLADRSQRTRAHPQRSDRRRTRLALSLSANLPRTHSARRQNRALKPFATNGFPHRSQAYSFGR